MTVEQIAFQVVYASVDAGGAGDPTERATRILRDERVLAALRAYDGAEVTALIPITEDGAVVALDVDGQLRFDLTAVRLQELFAAETLTLHLGSADDALEQVDAELDEQFADAFEMLDDQASSPEDLSGFGMPESGDLEEEAVEAVHVAEFSRRGPWGARLTSQLLGVDVDYLEAGTWSVYRYRTDQPHGAVTGGRADLPVIEVNIPQHGEAWIEVTAAGGRVGYFWVNGERLTAPVLDIDAIAIPESAELYRRMLVEADGVRDELEGLAMGDAVDIERALRACMPEALGGTVGESARIREFVAAFGVHESLAAAGVDDAEPGRVFSPRGWGRTLGDFALAGIGDTLALTRRDRPLGRLWRLLRKRPLLEAALSTGELAGGIALSRVRSPFGRTVGILLVIDAVADLVLWTIRIRRR